VENVVFPPAVPAGLAVVATAEGGAEASIDLSWQPGTETDLAGYAVYRREGDGAWLRISPKDTGELSAGKLGSRIGVDISNLWFVFRRPCSTPARPPAQAAKRPVPSEGGAYQRSGGFCCWLGDGNLVTAPWTRCRNASKTG